VEAVAAEKMMGRALWWRSAAAMWVSPGVAGGWKGNGAAVPDGAAVVDG